MIHPHIRYLIAENCEGRRRDQYQPVGIEERVWQKLTPERLVALLCDAASLPRYEPDGPSTSYLAGELLRTMKNTRWTIRAVPHTGGKGDARGVDESLHITLRVGSTTYHLRCKDEPILHIIQITD